MKISPVVHFEMPYGDSKKMTDFYGNVFDWQFEHLGEKMGNYIVAITTETDDKKMIKTPGTINGGFYKKAQDPLSHCTGIVIAVENLEESMQKIKEAGGKIMADWEIPKVGRYASVVDVEGNRIGILQPKM